MGWRPDGSAFFVSSNERDPRFFDIYRYDAETYARTLLYKNQSGVRPGAISRDERWIALNRSNTTSDSDIYLFDVAKQEIRHLTPHEGSISFRAETFDPASQKLFFLTNEGSEFKRLCTYDLITGEIREHESADWDVIIYLFLQGWAIPGHVESIGWQSRDSNCRDREGKIGRRKRRRKKIR